MHALHLAHRGHPHHVRLIGALRTVHNRERSIALVCYFGGHFDSPFWTSVSLREVAPQSRPGWAWRKYAYTTGGQTLLLHLPHCPISTTATGPEKSLCLTISRS